MYTTATDCTWQQLLQQDILQTNNTNATTMATLNNT